ncbi:bifunctional riboflavin kinase/FAD synthetase [Tissierella creatinophila]|uniref:Riboflavin biosynthesis protein n=1 Tax=Tissierella creatinophila DSM 6911 TaxID=1123403 RepID=A0A1U7M3A9_TISCR|nr:bifunctional riboflavin kinase/FAD synthetase [Tissierella creatinophila]OLS01766.1 riboflavin biosynthesis protein RibF [Tissierella creatinophila DSM 6911]
MEIIKIENYIENRFMTSVALGNFDGIHLGHRKLILSMIKDSKELNIIPSVLLFNKHPKEVLFGKSPDFITSTEDKHEILEQMMVKIIYETEFNEEFRKLSPECFVKKILIDKLNVKSVFVGFDYRFGYKASGDINTLKELGDKYKFKVTIIDPVYDEKRVLSSTEIRMHIKEGNIRLANEMLGRNYKIKGQVVHGNKIGRTLGFPTANLELSSNYQIPKIGVYETKTIIDGKSYVSLTSIGTNPTVGGNSMKIETYILDFSSDIYNKKIQIEFIKYIRKEMMFCNLEELKIQMQKDVETIKY